MLTVHDFTRLFNIENRYAENQTVAKEELNELLAAVNSGQYKKMRTWPTDTVVEPQTVELKKTETGWQTPVEVTLKPGYENTIELKQSKDGSARIEINARYDDEDQVIQGHPLYGVLTEAIRQAAYGKGERHGGAKTEFLEQPWYDLSKRFGVRGLLFQAAKKTGEAVGKTDYEAFEREVLGAIVYLGMSILRQREKSLEVPFNVV